MNLKKSISMIVAGSALMYTAGTQNLLAQAVSDATNVNKKPNFLTILVDDMGYSNLGSFGSEIATPHLDQLANEGIVLTNFHTAPTSTPARAMLFSGKDFHPAGSGTMEGWERPEQRDPTTGEVMPNYQSLLSLNVLPIPELLRDNGYNTILSGKWDLGKEEGYRPMDRGFEQDFALLPGGDNYWITDDQGNYVSHYQDDWFASIGRQTTHDVNGMDLDPSTLPPNTYTTNLYTDKAMEMLGTRDPNKPFYLTVAYTAPHDVYMAPADVIAKYIDTYAKGWDVIRQERFERQQQLGFWPQDMKLPERPETVPAWDSLTTNEQLAEAKRMAVYAAMVDVVDQNVGKLVEYLKQIGEYENTVFLFASDNGGPSHAPMSTTNATPKFCGDTVAKLDGTKSRVSTWVGCDNSLENLGSVHSSVLPSEGWGMVMNTPLNFFKGDTFEGGVRTPAFLYYAKSKATGVKTNCLTYMTDLAPTMLEMAGITYPSTYKDQPNSPLQGISLANLFEDNFQCDPERWIGWELDSGKGVIKGDWKLSQKKYFFENRWDDAWYLYNLADDPFESRDLLNEEPEQFQKLLELYQEYAKANQVVDVSSLIVKGDLGATLNGNPVTTTRISGGTAVNFSTFLLNSKVLPTDKVEVTANISPDSQYLGLPADIFVKVDYTPTTGEASSWAITLDPQLPVIWLEFWPAGQATPPVFFMNSAALPTRLAVPIFREEHLSGPGKLAVSVGFQLKDGTLVQSTKPIVIELVEPTPPAGGAGS